MLPSIIRTAKNAANMEEIYLQLSFRTAMLATVETLQLQTAILQKLLSYQLSFSIVERHV